MCLRLISLATADLLFLAVAVLTPAFQKKREGSLTVNDDDHPTVLVDLGVIVRLDASGKFITAVIHVQLCT